MAALNHMPRGYPGIQIKSSKPRTALNDTPMFRVLIIITCMRTLQKALKLTPDQLERWVRAANSASRMQGSSPLLVNSLNPVLILFYTRR